MKTREYKDHIGKRLFRDRRFVADLVEGFLPADLVGDLDLRTLRELPTEFISRGGDKRIGDALWIADRPNGAHVLLLAEIESTNKPRMASRMMVETGLVYETLSGAARGPGGHYPVVLPLVVHVGTKPWTAANDMARRLPPHDPLVAFAAGLRFLVLDVCSLRRDDLPERNRVTVFVRIHTSPSPQALVQEIRNAFRWMDEDEVDLRRALLDWVYAVVLPIRFPDADVRRLGLEQEEAMLAERAKQWTQEWLQEGMERGRAEGVERGRAEGMERGRAEGIERERSLLCRQAGRRFGTPVGDRLAALLAGVIDPARLDQVGDLIVDCASSDELFEHLDRGAMQNSTDAA